MAPTPNNQSGCLFVEMVGDQRRPKIYLRIYIATVHYHLALFVLYELALPSRHIF